MNEVTRRDGESESELMARFRACFSYYQQINSPGEIDDHDHDAMTAAWDRLNELESQVMELPATTLEELAAKVSILFTYCDPRWGLSEYEAALAVEVLEIVGIHLATDPQV